MGRPFRAWRAIVDLNQRFASLTTGYLMVTASRLHRNFTLAYAWALHLIACGSGSLLKCEALRHKFQRDQLTGDLGLGVGRFLEREHDRDLDLLHAASDLEVLDVRCKADEDQGGCLCFRQPKDLRTCLDDEEHSLVGTFTSFNKPELATLTRAWLS